MKTLYEIKTIVLNGTTTMFTRSELFASEELANKVLKKLEEQDKQYSKKANETFKPIRSIEKVTYYESEEEIPILNL